MTLPAWHAHPDVWALMASIVAIYLIACRRHEASSGQPVNAHARRLFLGGMAILWFASDWPMHDLAERYLYSAHMVQHMLYTLVAAPLLLTGIPVWMWRKLLE